MPISTNKTAIYLDAKKETEEAIGWYVKTIEAVEKQQDGRRKHLELLKNNLYELEKNYYAG